MDLEQVMTWLNAAFDEDPLNWRDNAANACPHWWDVPAEETRRRLDAISDEVLLAARTSTEQEDELVAWLSYPGAVAAPETTDAAWGDTAVSADADPQYFADAYARAEYDVGDLPGSYPGEADVEGAPSAPDAQPMTTADTQIQPYEAESEAQHYAGEQDDDEHAAATPSPATAEWKPYDEARTPPVVDTALASTAAQHVAAGGHSASGTGQAAPALDEIYARLSEEEFQQLIDAGILTVREIQQS